MYTNAFGRNAVADMLDIFADLVHMIFRIKPQKYTNAYGETIVADLWDMEITISHLFVHNFVLFLAIAIIVFAWQPLITPAAQNIDNLLYPAPQAVNLPAVIIVPSQIPATPTPTTAPTPTILNPVWVEIPIPQEVEIGIAIRQENDTLYLAGFYDNSMVINGLWKSTNGGLSWKLLSENPATIFPDIGTGKYFITIKEKGGVKARLYEAWVEEGEESWALLQMTQDGENWVTIQFPPISGFKPVDFSYDFVVKNDEITIYLTGGKVWQTTINLP